MVWNLADYIVDASFIVDILITFRTAHYDSMGQLVTEPVDIIKKYLHAWFVVDVVACFPADIIASAFSVNSYVPGVACTVQESIHTTARAAIQNNIIFTVLPSS